MPLYIFQSSDGEILNVVMDTKQPSECYHVQIKNGKTYKRVYTVPNMSVDSRVGVSKEEFRRATTNKKGLTVGQMQELSAEMHEKRTEREGLDPVKEEFYQKYEKDVGQKHPNVVKRDTRSARRKRATKAKEKLKTFGVEVSL